MKRKKAQHPATESRRRDIILAALACFSEIGFSETSMEDIRKRSGASTGSIYHHFKGKEQLAAELYMEGIRSYQEGFIVALAGCEDNAEKGIRAIVSHHVQWIVEHTEWSRYLFQKRHSVFMATAEEEIASLNREFSGRLSPFFLRYVKDKKIRMLPADITISLMLGPCMEFTRQYLSGQAVTSPERAIDHLSRSIMKSLSCD